MQKIYNYSEIELGKILEKKELKNYRSDQIWKGLYQQLYSDWNQFTTLPGQMRENLDREFSIRTIKPVKNLVSSDHLSEKTLFELEDGNVIETVVLQSDDRYTLCVSTQAGCAVNCAFCATGGLGFRKNLSSGEIIEQAIFAIEKLAKRKETLSNIVFMGMGEPFLNYDNTIDAIQRLNNPNGLNIGARRLTISTIGITDKIITFAQEGLQVNLAVSLHAANDHLRNLLIPISKNYPLPELIQACEYYFQLTRRRITFEYVMIKSVNDASEDALQLSYLLRDLTCHVNLIPLNPTVRFAGISPDQSVIDDFGKILINQGVPVTVRQSLGAEIKAGCGQLAGSR